MLQLEIFDKHTRQRIGKIGTYNFVQYIDEFCGAGSFSVRVPISESSLKYLQKGNYIWFEKNIVGIIKYRKELRQESTTITIEGPLCKKLLDYRVVEKTYTISGEHSSIANELVSSHFINPEHSKRVMSCISISKDPLYNPNTNSVSVQITGKSVLTGLQTLLSPLGFGFSLEPIFVDYNESTGQDSNIKTFEFRTIKPANRTLNNSEGNLPVVFSTELDNLASFLYEDDDSLFHSMSYVAGDGEGVDRIVIEIGDTESSDVDRVEGYVDARDIQRIQSDGTQLSEDKYIRALSQRGKEDLNLHMSSTVVQGTVLNNDMYLFERDYKNGDFVSLMDKSLNLLIDVPITSVMCSQSQQTGKVYDLSFGYKRAAVKQILKTKGVL